MVAATAVTTSSRGNGAENNNGQLEHEDDGVNVVMASGPWPRQGVAKCRPCCQLRFWNLAPRSPTTLNPELLKAHQNKPKAEDPNRIPLPLRSFVPPCFLQEVQASCSAQHCATMFYGSPSTYVFYDAQGAAHEVHQGEGGEHRGTGDPVMPALFGFGQHAALTEVRARLRPTDQLYAFFDDIHVTGPLEHSVDQFHIVGEALFRHAKIYVHQDSCLE